MINNKLFCELMCRIPERKIPSLVYDNYAKQRNFALELFKESKSDFEKLKDFKLPTLSEIRQPIPEESYDGLCICDKPLAEVGCGVFALAQGLVGRHDIVSHEMMEELASFLEKNGYYLVGSGLYWHVFKYVAGHLANHWYELVDAIANGNPVTILVKKPEHTRNYFMNLIGTVNIKAYNHYRHTMEITDPNSFVFITSDGTHISLPELFNEGFLVTAPWVWPTTI